MDSRSAPDIGGKARSKANDGPGSGGDRGIPRVSPRRRGCNSQLQMNAPAFLGAAGRDCSLSWLRSLSIMNDQRGAGEVFARLDAKAASSIHRHEVRHIPPTRHLRPAAVLAQYFHNRP